MNRYNWEQKDWTKFSYSLAGVEDMLFSFAEKTGHATGLLKALPEATQTEAFIDMMVAEAIKTSEIEGEYLSRRDVMSSIRNNLGLNKKQAAVPDKKAEGIGELMIDVRNSYKAPISKKVLFSWHKMLMRGSRNVKAGAWRTHEDPMQVVSGVMGKQKIHYEAPPSSQVSKEMDRFIIWFNETAPGGKKEIKKPLVRAAVAHLYFESIHPFEDGNGRIGRAIAEKALSQGIGRPVLLSLSRTIEAGKKAYYDALEKAQRSNKITPWIIYFVKTILAAQDEAEEQIGFTLRKVKFFDTYKDQLNGRQVTVIKRMLMEGPRGFEGGMNAAKYKSLAKTSKATATRDMQDLLEIGAFKLFGNAGGRSTKYQVNL
jgi:Fic family protein